MIKEYLTYLHLQEDVKNREKPWPHVEEFRKKNKYIWLYHGTPKEFVSIIKKNGIDPSKMGDYNKSHYMFQPGQLLHNKKVVWFTSYKKYANAYSSKSIKAELFKKHRGQTILAKLSTNPKHLIFGFTTQLIGQKTDEYMYVLKIPSKDILFPDDPQYYKIEKENKYLTPWKNIEPFKNK